MQNICNNCHARDYFYYTGILATPTYARCPPRYPNYYYARITSGYDDCWTSRSGSYYRCKCACHSN